MSKLFKLSGFVSIDEAQEYLSKAIGENVSLAEVYQLVLNRDLVISARFDANECALIGKYLPFTIEQYSKLLKTHQVPDEWSWVDIDYIYYDESRKQHYALNPSLTNVTGCWDFTMLGSEATVIDHYYRIQSTNSVDGGLFGIELKICRENILLTNGDEVAKLRSEIQSKQHVKFDYFLNKLVFKKQELNRFVQSLQDEPMSKEGKPVHPKERITSLVIAGALCKALKLDPSCHHSTSRLFNLLEENGTPLSLGTIHGYLLQIPDAVERRQK